MATKKSGCESQEVREPIVDGGVCATHVRERRQVRLGARSSWQARAVGDLRVEAMTDATAAIARSATLLAVRPVELNVIWSVMKQRADAGGRGRYWLLEDDGRAAGLVIESPPGQAASISPMARGHVEALAEAISAEGRRLSGVSGDASTASAFAGSWNRRVKVAAVVKDAQLLYALGHLSRPRGGVRALETGGARERALLVEWWSAFQFETGAGGEAASSVDFGLSTGRLFFWDDAGPRSMATRRHRSVASPGSASSSPHRSGVATATRPRASGRCASGSETRKGPTRCSTPSSATPVRTLSTAGSASRSSSEALVYGFDEVGGRAVRPEEVSPFAAPARRARGAPRKGSTSWSPISTARSGTGGD